MDDPHAVSGFGAVFKIEVQDATGKTWRCETADGVEGILDVVKDVVLHEIALDDLRQRLDDASKPS